jgi:hypothetical protein
VRRLRQGYFHAASAVSGMSIALFLITHTHRAAIVTSVLLSLLAIVVILIQSRRPFAWQLNLIAMALLVIGIAAWKDAWRFAMLESSFTIHPIPAYATRLARDVDDPGRPHRIAVASGNTPSADNQFMYYLFGRSLQNTVVALDASQVDDVQADFVVCLPPRASVLPAIEQSLAHFARIDGVPGEWGVFAVRR